MIVSVKFFTVPISLVVNLMILFTIIHVQTSILPFKSKWLGIVDSYLMINAAVLYIGNLFKITAAPQFANADLLYTSLFLGIAYVVIAAIFGYHIDSRFPVIREKLMKKIQSLMGRSDTEETRVEQTPEVVSTPSVSFLTSLPVEQPVELQCMRRIAGSEDLVSDSANYRDSILDTFP